jgi:hypothetical protein
MEAFEYAIKKDVRNNPIVREVDDARQRELWKSIGVACVLVLVLLVSAWQHFELLKHGYQVEELQRSAPPKRTSRAGCASKSTPSSRRSGSSRWRPQQLHLVTPTATRRSSSTRRAGRAAGVLGRRPAVAAP